jgi:surface antigen
MSKLLNPKANQLSFLKSLEGIVSTVVCLVLICLSSVIEAGTRTSPEGRYTYYARTVTGINIYGSPKDWHRYATLYGYNISNKPVVGAIISFEAGAYGADSAYGLVGVVAYYEDAGNYYRIKVRYANSYRETTGQYGYSGVSEREYRVLKNDPAVHYIYQPAQASAPRYYSCPEYSDSDEVILGKQYAISGKEKFLTIYCEDANVRAYIEPGQLIRILARSEVGETVWVFVETPYSPGVIFAKTPFYEHGKDEQLMRFNPYEPKSQDMYYARKYGDIALDLGYGDYSKIAGNNGKVTITIKKGGDARYLQTTQTINLQIGAQ